MDVPPTTSPSPFIGGQEVRGEIDVHLEKGEIQEEKVAPEPSGKAEPPKKKLKVKFSSAATSVSSIHTPVISEADIFEGLFDILLPDFATMAEIGTYSLGLATSNFNFYKYNPSRGH